MEYDDDSGLARLGILGSFSELRDHAREALADLDPDLRPGAAQEGTDESGSVTVTVGPRGDVVDVGISGWWSDRLDAADLGEAVLQAYSRAMTLVAAVAAIRKLRAEEIGAVRVDSSEPGPGASDGMPALDDPRWLGWIWESIGNSGLRLHNLSRQSEADDDGRCVVVGPGGHVRLSLEGRRISRVDIRRASRRITAEIAADARAAFRDAWHELGGRP